MQTIAFLRLVISGLLVALQLLPPSHAANAPDSDLQRDVQRILDAVDGLSETRTSAEAGVITLTGAVSTAEEAERAVRIAAGVEGVVAVNDRLRIQRSLDQRLAPVIDRFWARTQQLLSLLPLLLVAAVILSAFALLARFVASWDAPFERLVANPFLRGLSRSVSTAGVFFVGVLVALEILDATALLGAVLGSAGVLGLALGFAMRDTVENYLAAVLLSLRQPFAPHDHIALEGFEGQVVRLTSRATVLLTFDGNHVRIPNARVF